MAADIEAEAAVFDRPREAADVMQILLEDDDLAPISAEFVASAKTGRTGANNYDTLLRH